MANDQDGKILVSFFNDITRYYADVRNLTDATNEEIKARQLLCDIIDIEVISRLNKQVENKIIKEEYE